MPLIRALTGPEIDIVSLSMSRAAATYSNVHRGDGHFSQATSQLFEHARGIISGALQVDPQSETLIFGTRRGIDLVCNFFGLSNPKRLSSAELGLALGIHTLVLPRELRGPVPFHAGGGTIELLSRYDVSWSKAPEVFEPGTPNILGAIAMARGVQLLANGHDAEATDLRPRTSVDELFREEYSRKYRGRRLLSWLQRTLPEKDTPVPTADGNRYFVNLDYAASTPTLAPVLDCAIKALSLDPAAAPELIERVEALTAAFFGAALSTHDVLFTQNTTEAANILASHLDAAGPSTVVNSTLDHHSNELPWRTASHLTLKRTCISPFGFIKIEDLIHMLHAHNSSQNSGTERIGLVAVNGASNVLGSISNLQEITEAAHQYGARVMVDAAQLAAHRPVSMADNDIDYLIFSGHKMHAPFGTGGLIARKGLLKPEEMAAARQSGNENIAGIAALGMAEQLLMRVGLENIEAHELALTRQALSALGSLGIQNIEIAGIGDPQNSQMDRRGGIISFNFTGGNYRETARDMALIGGIGTRSGCFCAHILLQQLFNTDPLAIAEKHRELHAGRRVNMSGLNRISIGLGTRRHHIQRLADTLQRILKGEHATTSEQHRMQAFVEDVVDSVFGPY